MSEHSAILRDRTYIQYDNPDIFQYRPDKGWHWLQKLAIGTLRWVGAFRSEKQLEVLVMALVGPLTERLRKLVREMESYGRTLGPTDRVIMGLDDFNELNGILSVLPGDYGPFSTKSPPNFMGLRITVVPWMKGALLVPGPE